MRHAWIVIILCFAPLLYAQEVGLQFEQANEAYRKGDYQKAIGLYQQVIKNGYESSAIYYNLGNAYFKANDIPSSILFYERAKRLAPGDDDIAYNLRLANLRVVDKIEPVPQIIFVRWWNGIEESLSSDGWAVFAIVCLWALVGSGLSFFLFRSFAIRRISLLAAAIFIVLVVFGFFSVYNQYQYEQSVNNGIVFSPTVSVKSAPDDKSTDLFVIHEGVKVELLDVVGTWRKIRLADGKIGWLSQQAVRII